MTLVDLHLVFFALLLFAKFDTCVYLKNLFYIVRV